MTGLIGLLVLGGIILLNKISLDYKVNNYDMNKVSSAKMAMDYDKSPEYVQRKMVSGGYDKDAKHPF